MTSLATIATELRQGRANQYVVAATVAMTVYDTSLNFPREVELIWKARRSLVKYFYLFNRYSVPLFLLFHAVIMGGFYSGLNENFCNMYLHVFFSFTSLEGYIVSDTLVLLRVWALYKSVRGIRFILALLWLVNAVPAFVIVLLGVMEAPPGGSPAITLGYNSTLNMCTVAGRPSYMWCLWLGMLFFQSAICGMILYKTWGHRRSLESQNIVSLFLYDGLFFYTVILACEIVNLLLFLTLPDDLYLIAFLPDWSLSALLISRIYLNLRHATTYHEWTEATTLADSAEQESQIRRAKARQGRRGLERAGQSDTIVIGHAETIELGDFPLTEADSHDSEADEQPRADYIAVTEV